MATLENIARNAAVDAVVDLLDGGTIELLASDSTLIASIDLPTPAFGDASGGTANANSIAEADVESGISSLTADTAQVKQSDGTLMISAMSVGQTGDGTDVELSDVVFSTGSKVQVTSFPYTQPAS